MKIKYIHFRSEEDPQHVVVSVGYVLTPEALEVQVAKCRAPDTWCRWKAHKIIEGRFKKKGPLKKYPLDIFQHLTILEVLESEWHPDFRYTECKL